MITKTENGIINKNEKYIAYCNKEGKAHRFDGPAYIKLDANGKQLTGIYFVEGNYLGKCDLSLTNEQHNEVINSRMLEIDKYKEVLRKHFS